VVEVDSVAVVVDDTDSLLLQRHHHPNHTRDCDSNNLEVDIPHDDDGGKVFVQPHHWQFVPHEETLQYLDSNRGNYSEDHHASDGVVVVVDGLDFVTTCTHHSNDWEVVAAFVGSIVVVVAAAAADVANHYSDRNSVEMHDEYCHYPQPLTPMTKLTHNY
jgi:hypothetical protein